MFCLQLHFCTGDGCTCHEGTAATEQCLVYVALPSSLIPNNLEKEKCYLQFQYSIHSKNMIDVFKQCFGTSTIVADATGYVINGTNLF